MALLVLMTTESKYNIWGLGFNPWPDNNVKESHSNYIEPTISLQKSYGLFLLFPVGFFKNISEVSNEDWDAKCRVLLPAKNT